MSFRHAIASSTAALCCMGLSTGCAPDRTQASAAELGVGKVGPPDPCPPPEDVPRAMDETTGLGVSAYELLDRVLPLDAQPLFWVAYDSVLPASYLPGVSATSVSLQVQPRLTEPVMEHVFAPDGPDPICRASRVDVPVSLWLKTADGALDEHLDGVLKFFAPMAAGLSAFVPADMLAGSFSLMPTAELAPWELMGLALGISVWPGGSRGSIAPEFRERGSSRLPDPGQPGARDVTGDGATPALPRHWDLLAVWPRREACASGTAYALQDQLGGWSPRELMSDVTTQASGALQTAEGSTRVHFALEAPTELTCIDWLVQRPSELRWLVPGRLTADATAPASALQHLDASSTFELAGHVSQAGTGIQSLSWQRPQGPFVVGQSQQQFAAATGLGLNASDPDQQFVWSWNGNSTRGATADWMTTGQFTVQSAREQEGKICQATTLPPRGTPAPAPSCTTFPFSELGDTVLSAELVP
jgi:hypothetical protein